MEDAEISRNKKGTSTEKHDMTEKMHNYRVRLNQCIGTSEQARRLKHMTQNFSNFSPPKYSVALEL